MLTCAALVHSPDLTMVLSRRVDRGATAGRHDSMRLMRTCAHMQPLPLKLCPHVCAHMHVLLCLCPHACAVMHVLPCLCPHACAILQFVKDNGEQLSEAFFGAKERRLRPVLPQALHRPSIGEYEVRAGGGLMGHLWPPDSRQPAGRLAVCVLAAGVGVVGRGSVFTRNDLVKDGKCRTASAWRSAWHVHALMPPIPHGILTTSSCLLCV